MRDLTECEPFVAHLRIEHRQIHQTVRDIMATLAAPVSDRQFKEFRTNLRQQLNSLRDNLAHHFTEEKTGGCIEEAVSRCPSLSPDATKLEKQHPDLLRQLDQVIQQSSPDLTARTCESIKHSFAEFAQVLNAHESAENKIIQHAFGAGFEEE